MTFQKEIERLHALGYALHWLKPKSKAPVESGWTTRERESLASLKSSFRKGNGLGVRLGRFSFLGEGNGYLAVIDVDVKGSKEHQLEALRVLEQTFPGIRRTAPCVKTGRGFHFYVRTKEPVKSGKVKTSHEEVTVHSPSTPLSRRQEEKLSADELAKGMRVKNAWEVDFMSEGRQVVMPPTLHADTREPYVWVKPVESVSSLPWVEGTERPKDGSARGPGRPAGSTVVQGFEPVEVDLVSSRLSDTLVDAILTGEGVEDRSAYCFSVCLAMLRAGYSEGEILSVLTDRSTFLGETAYDHRKTDNRKAAAAWVRDYCLKKAKESLDASRVFAEEVVEAPLLTDAEADAQLEELVDESDWRLSIQRSGKNGDGPPKPTLRNILLILENALPGKLFKRDIFATRDTYAMDTPWGRKDDTLVEDIDTTLIKVWLAENYRFEPNKNVITEAIDYLSHHNGFHPIREQWAALPAWDGVGRLDTWFKNHFEAEGDDEYLAQVFRKWMVAAVTRIYEPGAKFDWMIILEGAQGVGKSSFGAKLFGQKVFKDDMARLDNKDAAGGLRGVQCVEFGELASLQKNEIEAVKAFVTRQVDKFRPPYGEREIEAPRQCVFFGTTNKQQYFKDETGNRRFVPVVVGRLDFEALARDREQLWAEAIFIYQNGLEDSLYLEGRAAKVALEIQDEKVMEDETTFMAEAIRLWLARIENGDEAARAFSPEIDLNKFKLVTLFLEGGPLSNFRKEGRYLVLAGRAAKLNNFVKKRTNDGKWWGRDD